MNTLELVKSRRSVRTFDGKVPDKETVMDIMQHAYTTTNPYNLPITKKKAVTLSFCLVTAFIIS